ncbi:MAG: four helix bundle protein [bacterium]|nr:four helix bundle protein [bacterium]
MIKEYKDLIVWQKSILLVKDIYLITKQFPKEEVYNLTSQMRRSAISVPSNIAEGYCRRNKKEYIQFLGIASGSAAELETQIIIAKEIYSHSDYVKAESLLQEIRKMLFVLVKKLNSLP